MMGEQETHFGRRVLSDPHVRRCNACTADFSVQVFLGCLLSLAGALAAA